MSKKNYSKYYEEKVEEIKVDDTVEVEELEEIIEDETKVGTVNVPLLNVRESASADSEIVGSLEKGEVVDILGEENGFYKLDAGYCMKEYITV